MTKRAHLDIKYISATPIQITVRKLARHTAHLPVRPRQTRAGRRP